MSERTAEYVLVPDLIVRLQQTFSAITPFFHWASREGQSKAQASYDGPVRLLAAYARRPKVHQAGDPEISIKFNELLFYHAQLLGELGVPLLAGAPCISRLSDLHLGIPCAWFQVQAAEQAWPDAHAVIRISNPTHATLEEPHTPILGPLTSEEIVTIVRESATVRTWPSALSELSRVKRDRSLTRYARDNWFGPFLQYRPFYLALRE